MDTNEKKYDAVLFDSVTGGKGAQRIHGALNIAEAYVGKPAYIREVGRGRTLGTPRSSDTLMFPKTHDLEGEERYTWEDGPNGVKLGTLRAEAKP